MLINTNGLTNIKISKCRGNHYFTNIYLNRLQISLIDNRTHINKPQYIFNNERKYLTQDN